MTSYTNTWTHSQNLTPSNEDDISGRAAALVFDIKVKLLAAGWTVTQSSDGSTAQVIGSGDLWDTYDKAETRHASGDRSWIILKSPNNFPTTDKNVYLMLDRRGDSTASLEIGISSLDWSGTPDPDPDSMTNANEHVMTDRFLCHNTNDQAHKLHMHTTTAGDFIIYISYTGSGSPGFGMILNKLTDFQSGDGWPVVFYSYNSNAGYNATTMWTSNSGYYYQPFTLGHVSNSLSTTSATANNARSVGWWTDGTAINCHVGSVDDSMLLAFNAGGDDYSGKWMRFPIYVSGYEAGRYFYRGQLIDIKASHGIDGTTGQGIVEPSSGDIQSTTVDHIMIPASAAPIF